MKIVILLFACMALPDFTSAMEEAIEGTGPSTKPFDILVGSKIYIWNAKGVRISGNLIRRDTYPVNVTGEYGFVVVESEGKKHTASLTSQTETYNGNAREVKDAILKAAYHTCRITRPGATDLIAFLEYQVIPLRRRVIFYGPEGHIISQGLLEHAIKGRPRWIAKEQTKFKPEWKPKQTEASGSGC